MPPLSAVDAIQPAWTHTRLLLWGRRDVRLLLKLAAVAFFAEVGSGFSSSLRAPGRLGHGVPAGLHAALVPLLIAFACLALAFGLVMFYLSSRLQFVLFHTVLRGEVQVAPAWRRYGPATWRWLGLKLLFYLAVILCMLPVVLPAILLVLRSMPKQGSTGPALGALFAGIFSFLAVMLLVFFVAAIVFVLLRDFGLPSMALEGTSLGETVRRATSLIRSEPGPTALYLLMRFVLGLAGAFASYAVLLVVAAVAALPLGGIAFALWAGLRASSASGHVFMIAGWVLLGLLLAALLFTCLIVLFGVVFTFLQAFAIFYLAGRYPLMAAQLVLLAPTPRPMTAFVPPPAPYPGWAGPPPTAS